jgi:TolB-like protein/lipopolysaccharide biosynthesis regulator YciM
LADIFLSYARPDRERIGSLTAALEQAGWSVWWDRHIDGGAAFAKAIEAELNASRVVIVAWSQASLQSDWVKDEAATARDQGKLVPVSVDGAAAPLGFKQYHVIDLSTWTGDPSAPAFADLLRTLEARMRGGTPMQPREAAPAQVANSGRGKPSRSRGLVIGAIALAVLAGVIAFVMRGEHPGTDAPATTATGSAGTASAIAQPGVRDKSIAVLPFANRSARADDAYFAEGVHDDLLGQLSKMKDVRVISRTSVMRYAGTDMAIPEIASELGVGAILEGGVQRSGDRVRINVQLIDGRTDAHLWAETFDRELTVENLFEIQSEITQAIAAALKSVLSAPEGRLAEELPTQDTTAFNAYLLGNTLNRYETRDPNEIVRATRAYGEAVAIDPQFAAAHARKAVAHLTLTWWGVDPAENTRLAEESLARARALAPQSIETLIAEGYHRYWVQLDYAGAHAALQTVLEQSPQNARLWSLQGAVARRAGDMAGSTAAWQRVLEIDPNDSDAAANLAVNHAYLGQLNEARQWLSRAAALSPDSGYNMVVEGIVLNLSADADAVWERYEHLRATSGAVPGLVDGQFSGLARALRDPVRLETLTGRLAKVQAPGELVQLFVGLNRAEALRKLGRQADAETLARDLKARLAVVKAAASARDDVQVLAIAIDAFLGDVAAARKGADALTQHPSPDHLWIIEDAPLLMSAYAELGDPDAAFDLAEQAMDQFSPAHFANLAAVTAFDDFRELPRYRKLEARYAAWKAASQ